MTLRSLRNMIVMMAGALLAVLLVGIIGSITFFWIASQDHTYWSMPVRELSDALTEQDGRYVFAKSGYLEENGAWAMLIDNDGAVQWAQNKPEEVPEHYQLTDVAAFSRWYLCDYPVHVHIRPDGLFVVGVPKGSVWKYAVSMSMRVLDMLPAWLLSISLLCMGAILALSYYLVRHWMKKEQQQRDRARSDWIHGISHDIRTPLSVVMGYAAQLAADRSLPQERRAQASAICLQSRMIRELVNDLNLTMRLDYQMQPLRIETVYPEALVRQAAADLLNSGMAEGFALSVEPAEHTPAPILADGFLIRRALNNLLVNGVRHNHAGCKIRLGAMERGKWTVFWVESGDQAARPEEKQGSGLEADGDPMHGTGLKLVRQIAQSHGGRAVFTDGDCFRCEICLPAPKK